MDLKVVDKIYSAAQLKLVNLSRHFRHVRVDAKFCDRAQLYMLKTAALYETAANTIT